MAVTKTKYQESAIVNLWNGQGLTKDEENWRDSAERAIALLKRNGVTGTAVCVGGKHTQITGKWLEYKRMFMTQSRVTGTSQSKVDIVIGNHRISLKNGKKTGIMSSMVEETMAAFYSTNEHLKGRDSELEIMFKKMRRNMFTDPGLNQTQSLKVNCPIALDRQEHNKACTKKLNQILNEKPDIKHSLIFEGLTGQKKFGIENAATHILHLDDGHDTFNEINTEYIANLNVLIEQKFKSESEKKRGRKTGRYHLKHVFLIGLP